MLPRRLDQIFAGLGRAERRMRRQRYVRQFRQGMIHRQRFDVEDVEPGMPDLTRLQRLDHGVLVDQCAARGVDQDHAWLHRLDACARDEPAGLII